MHDPKCLLVPKARLFSSVSLCFSVSPGRHALHAGDETPGEVKRGAGMEFCSIYHPEIFLLERHTLFSPSLLPACLFPSLSLLISVWHVVISLHCNDGLAVL